MKGMLNRLGWVPAGVLPFFVLLVAAGCVVDDGETSKTVTHSFSGSDGGVFVMQGVKIEVESKVKYDWRFTTETIRSTSEGKTTESSGDKSSLKINGQALRIKDGVLFIGDRRYGEVKEGDTVSITGDQTKIDVAIQ